MHIKNHQIRQLTSHVRAPHASNLENFFIAGYELYEELKHVNTLAPNHENKRKNQKLLPPWRLKFPMLILDTKNFFCNEDPSFIQ